MCYETEPLSRGYSGEPPDRPDGAPRRAPAGARPCRLVPLMATVTRTMRRVAEARGISLRMEYGGAAPETIATDEFQLHCTLAKLIANAAPPPRRRHRRGGTT